MLHNYLNADGACIRASKLMLFLAVMYVKTKEESSKENSTAQQGILEIPTSKVHESKLKNV